MNAVVVIPTYNESGNIVPLLSELLGQDKGLRVLVVDDFSPDGTWRLVEGEAGKSPRVRLLLRKTDRGRGLAGVAGFRRALEMGAELVVEMDGDFSHAPGELPALLSASSGADVVIGSRFVPGGSDEARGKARRAASLLARMYLRIVLGLKVKDPASGYRCFRREALEKILERPLSARGPFIITETLYRCHKMGMRIVEVPIHFRSRKAGSSKLGVGTLLRYLIQALRLRLGCGEEKG